MRKIDSSEKIIIAKAIGYFIGSLAFIIIPIIIALKSSLSVWLIILMFVLFLFMAGGCIAWGVSYVKVTIHNMSQKKKDFIEKQEDESVKLDNVE